jgi:hypothetical protein
VILHISSQILRKQQHFWIGKHLSTDATFGCGSMSLTWWNGASQNNQPVYKSSITGYWTSGMSMQVNTLYSITLEWDGGNNVWVIGLDGGIFTFSDPNFALVGGNGFFIEPGINSNVNDYPHVASVSVTQQVSAVKTDQVTASTLQGILGIPAMSPGYFSWLGVGTQTLGAPLHVTAYPGNAASMLYVESTTANPNQATVQIKDDNWGYKVAYYLNVGEGDQSTGLVDEGGLSGRRP